MWGFNMRDKILFCFLVLTLCFGTVIIFKKEKLSSRYEKRYYTLRKDILSSSVYDKQIFKKIENYFSDQLFYRDKSINLYNKSKRKLTFFLNQRLTKLNEGEPELTYFDDGYYIIFPKGYKSETELVFANKGYNLTELKNKFPDIPLYVYHVRRIEDTNLLGGTTLENYGEFYHEKFLMNLGSQIKFKNFEIFDENDYKENFYKTDYHWNNRGAYKGYQQIVELIQNDFKIDDVREIMDEKCFERKMLGNFATILGGSIDSYDNMCIYHLKGIGNYDYYVDDVLIENASDKEKDLEKSYENGYDFNPYSDYDYLFGGNNLKRLFDFKDPTKPNILIFSDSFANPIKTWLASHFNKTLIIDTRSLKGEKLNLSRIIKDYEIDLILDLKSEMTMENGNLFIPLDD